MIEFYLFVSHSVMEDRGSTCCFQKALRAFNTIFTSEPSVFHTTMKTNKQNPITKYMLKYMYV